MPKKTSLIIISGPTCVGKTDVAIAMAEPLGAEIITVQSTRSAVRWTVSVPLSASSEVVGGPILQVYSSSSL